MGRPANLPNKNKRGLALRLKEAYGDDFDVILMMAKNCKTLHDIALDHSKTKISVGDSGQGVIDASNSATAANTALEKLAQYIEPKIKATEITGADGGPIETKLWAIEIVDPKKEGPDA